MAVSMIGPKFYAWDRNGKPLAFGKLYTYQARTNIPKATYQSEDQVVANTNPVILNGEGYANVYLSGSYKMVLKDKDDNEIWTADPVSESGENGFTYTLTAFYLSSNKVSVRGDHYTAFPNGAAVVLGFNDAENEETTTVINSKFTGTNTEIEFVDPVVKTSVNQVSVANGFSVISSYNEELNKYVLRDVGNYDQSPRINEYFEFVNYNGSPYFAIQTPYTVDPITYPDPSNDPNLRLGYATDESLVTNSSATIHTLSDWLGSEGSGDIPVTATGTTTPRRLDDRFADVVNVKDFGAVGSADDTNTLNIAAQYASANNLPLRIQNHVITGVVELNGVELLTPNDFCITGTGEVRGIANYIGKPFACKFNVVGISDRAPFLASQVGDYVVDPLLGSDAGTGTYTDPLLTINEAYNRASDGDVILLRGGRHEIGVEISGSKTVTIKSALNESASITPLTSFMHSDSGDLSTLAGAPKVPNPEGRILSSLFDAYSFEKIPMASSYRYLGYQAGSLTTNNVVSGTDVTIRLDSDMTDLYYADGNGSWNNTNVITSLWHWFTQQLYVGAVMDRNNMTLDGSMFSTAAAYTDGWATFFADSSSDIKVFGQGAPYILYNSPSFYTGDDFFSEIPWVYLPNRKRGLYLTTSANNLFNCYGSLTLENVKIHASSSSFEDIQGEYLSSTNSTIKALTIKGCEIFDVDLVGCIANNAEANYVHNTGSGGIRSNDNTGVVLRNKVVSPAEWNLHGSGISGLGKIMYNKMYDTPYIAINTVCNPDSEADIRYNLIDGVGTKNGVPSADRMLADGGAIYVYNSNNAPVTGETRVNIYHNVVLNVNGYELRGIFGDNGAHSTRIQGNLVGKTSGYGIDFRQINGTTTKTSYNHIERNICISPYRIGAFDTTVFAVLNAYGKWKVSGMSMILDVNGNISKTEKIGIKEDNRTLLIDAESLSRMFGSDPANIHPFCQDYISMSDDGASFEALPSFLPIYTSNGAALGSGLQVGEYYRDGTATDPALSAVCVVY